MTGASCDGFAGSTALMIVDSVDGAAAGANFCGSTPGSVVGIVMPEGRTPAASSTLSATPAGMSS